ncbi:MAG: adenosylmethionine--8-amino-7-oxononanoate transaminase [Bdellovibrionales bacterium]|nr:adenosylmethionine--8-amino-7-oxononanoate transaminase [Bdellovibrionales bacterium]
MNFIWRPFTQMQKVKEFPEVVRAKDSILYLKNGKKIIDAISSWWLITHGHCQKDIVKAIQESSQELDQILFANFTHSKAEQLVKELSEFLPSQLNKFFFSDNGSTAVESGLKMAVQSRIQKGEPERNKFLSFKNSYHGDTVGAMSVSARGIFNRPYKSFLFPIYSCSQGSLSFDSEEKFYRDFERQLEKHHKKLCAVIIEPLIQGAGGMIIWPVATLKRICRLAKSRGLYLIFDEVMTGFGRTGSLFAFEQIGITPDILCLSKGLTGGILPLALTISTDSIYKNFLSPKKEKALLHGHSFTGNPLSCSAALANLKVLKKNKSKLLKKWKQIESINCDRLKNLKPSVPIKDKRAKGLVAVVQKKGDYSSDFSYEAYQKALKQGVFIRPLGGVIYILPPYCISKQELHKVWDVIESLI